MNLLFFLSNSGSKLKCIEYGTALLRNHDNKFNKKLKKWHKKRLGFLLTINRKANNRRNILNIILNVAGRSSGGYLPTTAYPKASPYGWLAGCIIEKREKSKATVYKNN